MNKIKVRLNICGTECTLTSEDNETYVLALGDEVEKSIQSIMSKNDRVSLTLAAIITALSFCDDAKKAAAAADNLRSQIKDYLEPPGGRRGPPRNRAHEAGDSDPARPSFGRGSRPEPGP